MAEQMDTDTDALCKEFEPDANEIMFGQKTLPDRPLTIREASKRKKIIMKLVDQKLKFKLIELMRQQVAAKATTTIPIVSQTINNTQPLHNFTSYQSQSSKVTDHQPNWFPYSGSQHAEGNWQQHCHDEWQSWNNNFSFQPNVQSIVPGNIQHFHQHLNRHESPMKNLNLIRPVVDATYMSNWTYNNNKNSTKTSLDVQEKLSVPRSSLISINCNQKSQDKSNVNEPPTKNPCLSTLPQLSIVKQITPNKVQQPLFSLTAAEKSTNSPLKPRRQRRYGRKKELVKQINRSARNAVDNVVFRDKFGTKCIANVSNVATDDGNGLWNEINRMVTSIFRKEVNQMEPLSSYEQKLQYKIMIEITTNPDTLRLEKVVSQFLTRTKIEEIISNAKLILHQVKRSNPQAQCHFSEMRENLIRDLKAMNDDAVIANQTKNVQLIETKVNSIIDSILCTDVDETKRNKLISQLIVNPRALETSELITKAITNKVDVMREIKRILDELMIARPGKTFYIPIHRTMDVPFVVALHEKSGKMSEENATILREALIAKAESVISQIKPKIIDPKFSDGSLVMVCANRKTFDLVKTMISGDFNGKWKGADLTVTPVQVKNPLARSDLKTVLLKFTEPQFYHFNHLMEQLKNKNPRLLVRRWELHQPPSGKQIDSTECLFVGVDIESLGTIEQLNRVAVLSKSTVTFEICYDERERNYLPDHALLTK